MRQAVRLFETSAPLPVERLLLGKPVEEVVALLPRIFSLCAGAQRLAIRMALGLEVTPADLAGLQQDIHRDHALYLGVMLPKALGLPVHPAPLNLIVELKSFFNNCPDLEQFLTELCPIFVVLREIERRFADGAASIPELPLPTAERMTSSGPIENSVAAQHRSSQVMRHAAARYGRGPLWRVLARVLALSSCLPAPVPPRQGVAIVPASRGLYMLAAAAEEGRLTRFARVTPTDHMLAPGGILDQSLATCPADQRRCLLAILDPCQPVTLKEAAHA